MPSWVLLYWNDHHNYLQSNEGAININIKYIPSYTWQTSTDRTLLLWIWLDNTVSRVPLSPVSCLLCTKDVIIALFCLCFTRQECLENVSCAGRDSMQSPDIIITLRHPPPLNTANFKLSKTLAKYFTPSLSLCLSLCVSRFICNFVFSPANFNSFKTSHAPNDVSYI